MDKQAVTTKWCLALIAGASLLLLTLPAFAQVNIGGFAGKYQDAASKAWDVVRPFAYSLFAVLASLQIAWAAIMLALEKADFQGWVVGLVRQVFFIGIGYAILENAKDWMWAIFTSFANLGQKVSPDTLQPGDIFGYGITLARTVSSTSVGWDIPLGLAYLLASLVIVVAFSMMAVMLLLALIEGAIAVVLGQILLGFAGSKWTIGYTEKYIGLIVNVGLKVFTTYFMAATAIAIVKSWMDNVSVTDGWARVQELVGGSIILAILVFAVPKFVSMIIGGAPSLGFSDASTTVAGMATAIGTVAGTAVAGAHKVGGAAAGAMRGNTMLGSAGTSNTSLGQDGFAVPPPTIPGGPSGAGGGTGGTGAGYRGTSPAGGLGHGTAFQKAAGEERPSMAAQHTPPTRDHTGSSQEGSEGSRHRMGGQNDLVSAAAQGVAAQAGMSRFVPSSVGAASGAAGPGMAAPDSGSAGTAMPPPLTPGTSMGGGAVPPPVGSAVGGTSGPGLDSRGGAEVAGNAPQGISGIGDSMSPSSPAGITTTSPMTMPGGSGTPGMTSGGAGSIPAATPIPGGAAETGMSAAASMAAVGAMAGSSMTAPPSPPPPPPPAPVAQREQLPTVHDDYERMDKANRRNRLTLDQPRNPNQSGLRGPSRPKP